MSSPHPSYRHVQLFVVLWLTLPASAAASAIAAWWAPLPLPAALALGLSTLVPLLLLLWLGRLVIELHGTSLHWSFGYVGWPRWSVGIDEIERIEITKARAIQGSGIKGLGRRRLYNVHIGGPVLQLELRDGRTIQLGTSEPQRLRSFIEARRG